MATLMFVGGVFFILFILATLLIFRGVSKADKMLRMWFK